MAAAALDVLLADLADDIVFTCYCHRPRAGEIAYCRHALLHLHSRQWAVALRETLLAERVQRDALVEARREGAERIASTLRFTGRDGAVIVLHHRPGRGDVMSPTKLQDALMLEPRGEGVVALKDGCDSAMAVAAVSLESALRDAIESERTVIDASW